MALKAGLARARATDAPSRNRARANTLLALRRLAAACRVRCTGPRGFVNLALKTERQP
jgi:hypothetical protein